MDQLPDLVQNDSVIKVYYEIRHDLSYTIRYLEKGTLTEIKEQKHVDNQEFNARIKANDLIESIDGFIYDSAYPNELRITTNESRNIITLTYSRNSYSYQIKYYYDGIEDTSARVRGFAKYGASVSYEPKEKYGYKLDRASTNELVIGSSENILEVYYIPDEQQTKELSYTVEFYKDNEIVTDDTLVVKRDIQVLEPDTLVVDKTAIEVTDKYRGYTYQGTDPEDIPDSVPNGSIIKVYYTIRNDLSYVVNYLEKGNNNILSSQTTKDNQTYGSVINSLNEVIEIEGFAYDSVNIEQLVVSDDESENIINIYYRRMNYPYEIRYFYNNVMDPKATIADSAPYESEITYIPKDKAGYIFNSVSRDRMIIGTGENIINVYYVVDNDQMVTYTYYVEYYIDNVLKERIPYSKTVQILESPKLYIEDGVINTTDKFEGYAFVRSVPSMIPVYVYDGEVIKIY